MTLSDQRDNCGGSRINRDARLRHFAASSNEPAPRRPRRQSATETADPRSRRGVYLRTELSKNELGVTAPVDLLRRRDFGPDQPGDFRGGTQVFPAGREMGCADGLSSGGEFLVLGSWCLGASRGRGTAEGTIFVLLMMSAGVGGDGVAR